MPPDSSGDVTRLLAALSEGKQDVAPVLVPLVYNELRRLAEYHLRKERPDHTLQATALVHEAYLKLVDKPDARWQDRAHFFAVAAQAMRRVLMDHARARRGPKRAGAQAAVTLDEARLKADEPPLDLVALDLALERLTARDAQQGRVVELRFFGGLTIEETAEVLGISAATVKREWAMARAWLRRELQGTPRRLV
jgi:RNA polymerase sigma-70 factor (ECF subfamily)